jgi:IS1 family transposase/transposase-like protein
LGAFAVILISCEHTSLVKRGKGRNGLQRYRCKLCGKYLEEQTAKPIGSMRIDLRDAVLALHLLLEGMSIRSVERITGLHRDTIDDLILVAGENCAQFLDAKVRDVKVDDVQLDEIWSFVGMKEKNRIARGYSEELGDSWTFIAIERNTKLVLAHRVGQRDNVTCRAFLKQLNQATVGRFQLSTDGLNAYTLEVPFQFGSWVDFAQLIKTYASQQQVTRYSPATITSCEKVPRFGNPDHDRICTSHVERLNLTLRMTLRRFTRLTNAHSKSPKHHAAMQAIFFAFYNFVRPHQALGGKTPAMASGLTDRAWTLTQLLEAAATL